MDPEKEAAMHPTTENTSPSPSLLSPSLTPRLGASNTDTNAVTTRGKKKDTDTASLSSHSSSQTSSSSNSDPGLHPDPDHDVDPNPDALSPLEHALSAIPTRANTASAASRPPDYEVVFSPSDPDNPRNWPLWYRAWVTICVSYSAWVVVLYSTSYTATIEGVKGEFGIGSTSVATLGLSTYLIGLAAGSVILAPLSELYGRRVVYLVCMGLFTVLIVPCGLARSFEEIVVVRFLGAVFGAVMVSNSPGTIVDIIDDEYLALYMSLWSIAPLNGPVTGPLIGGFVYQYLGWRWANWVALILAGVAVLAMSTLKETYAPTILRQRTAAKRKETDDERWWCRYEERVSSLELLKLNLSRPFVLAATEPILWCFNIWFSVIYAILYLCFIAYPIVFIQYRGWTPGESGLAFLGMGIGTVLAIALEPFWRRVINRSSRRDPDTGRAAPEATAIVMTVGAFFTPIGQLVFAWTSLPTTIHWALPIGFGIPFGLGNTLCFVYGSNYLASAYGIYAASAMAGNTVMRSVFGAALPLAGPAMYKALTPQWAGTLLGILEVLLIPIPFVFYLYGDRIRSKSTVIRQMREDRARNEERRVKQAARASKRATAGRDKEVLESRVNEAETTSNHV